MTACGKSDSKRSKARVRGGQAANEQSKLRESERQRLRAEEERLQNEREKSRQENSDQDSNVNIDLPNADDGHNNQQNDDGETNTTTPNQRSNNDNHHRDHNNTNHDPAGAEGSNDRQSGRSGGVLSPAQPSSPQNDSTSQGGSTNTTQQITEVDYFLKYYKATPFFKSSLVNPKALTGYSTQAPRPELKFTDLKSNDGVMSGLKDIFKKDIIKNETIVDFKQNSLALAGSIALVVPYIYENGKVELTVDLIDEENNDVRLQFSGKLNNKGYAVLPVYIGESTHPEAKNYVAEIKCLDQRETCQTQQITISNYFEDNNDNQEAGVAGKLCKKAYLVSRAGNATLNIDHDVVRKHLDNIDVCEGPNANLPENAITCYSALIYNSFKMSQYKSCTKEANRRTNHNQPECTQHIVKPHGLRAEEVRLHTYAVAHGEAGLLLSIKDSHQKYLSLRGKLLSSSDVALSLNHESLRYDYNFGDASVLLKNIKFAYLNGIDRDSTLQFKLRLNKVESNEPELFFEVVPRFPTASKGRLENRYYDSLPSAEDSSRSFHAGDDSQAAHCSTNNNSEMTNSFWISEEKYRNLLTDFQINKIREQCAAESDSGTVNNTRCLNNRANQFLQTKLEQSGGRDELGNVITNFPQVQFETDQDCSVETKDNEQEEDELSESNTDDNKYTITVSQHYYEKYISQDDIPYLLDKCSNKSNVTNCMANYARDLIEKRRHTYRNGEIDNETPGVGVKQN